MDASCYEELGLTLKGNAVDQGTFTSNQCVHVEITQCPQKLQTFQLFPHQGITKFTDFNTGTHA